MSRVFDFLLPREEKFYDLLTAQAQTSLKAAEKLEELIGAYNGLSIPERRKRIQHIRDLEAQGDKETHALIDKLHTSFITPIDREDIHELAVLLDDQVDYVDNVGKKLATYHVRKLPASFLAQVAIAHKAIREVHEAVLLLRTPQRIRTHLVKIHEFEEQADAVFAKAMEALFENGADPLEVIKLKDVYETAEAIADNAQAVAVLLEGIVVKHA